MSLKRVALILIVAFMLTLTGCRDAAVTADGKMDIISIWTPNSHSKTEQEKRWNKWNYQNGRKLGIKVEYRVIPFEGYDSTITASIASADSPDFFAGNCKAYAELGYILPVSELPGGEALISSYDKKYIYCNENMYNGEVYCLPLDYGTQGLIYNKDMFRKAGLVDSSGEPKPPETFEELREYAKILTNPKKKQYGIILPMKWNGWFNSDILHPMQSSAGHMGYNPVTGEYDFSMLEPIMDTYLGIKADGSCYPGSETLDNDTARARFALGGIGMKFGYTFDVGVLSDQFPAKCDWGVAPYPVVDKNNKYMQRCTVDYSLLINSKAITRHSPYKIMTVYKEILNNSPENYESAADFPHKNDSKTTSAEVKKSKKEK
ncbi:MAG: extracellular solute-binding protein, partial [Clostridiales bacterium]|nr:extracellular solute-binding protein [Clostridiales bacterium]